MLPKKATVKGGFVDNYKPETGFILRLVNNY
ncbi:hypothetical protein VAA_00138 [Vibrio anguillarum 775]|nr:hypothetical protein VAA_00138 [Vibrio anguillarum 775]